MNYTAILIHSYLSYNVGLFDILIFAFLIFLLSNVHSGKDCNLYCVVIQKKKKK